MRDDIHTVFIINGAENSAHSQGNYNRGLTTTAQETLAPHFKILTTEIAKGYDPLEEIEKYKQANIVIYQYPVYWFMVPSSLKKYMDEVFTYGDFYIYSDGPYGSGGLMQGKKILISTSWNAPQEAFHDTDAFFDGMAPEEAILAMRKAHQYCGFQELPHFSAHNVVKDPQFETNNSRFAVHLKKTFGLDDMTVAA